MTYPIETYNGHPARYSTDANGLVDGFIKPNSNSARVTAWEDLRFPAQGINPAGQTDAPQVDTATFPGTLLFSNSAINLIAGVAQLPHAWERGTEIHPHIHWAKSTSASGGVTWEMCYSIADIGGTFGAYSSWVAATEAVSDDNTANKQSLHSWPAIAMTGYKESTMIAWQIRRNVDATADNYAAVARFFEMDFHYQVGKLGTTTEIPA